MRESTIIDELSRLKKRCALMYKQMVFCNTRMQAFEKVLAGSGWSRFLFVAWPAAFMAAVDKVQLRLMNEHDEALRQAEQAPPPQRLTVIAANGEASEKVIRG